MQRRTRPRYTNGSLLSFLQAEEDGTYTVAVVGNGPLYDSDRFAINRSRNVIRFNDMNYRRAGEKVSLRAVHYPFAKPPQTTCNAPIWGLAPSPADLPENVAVYTWTYEPALTHASINMLQYALYPKAQVLEPWQELVQYFEECDGCGLKCHSNETSSGPSAGAVALSELHALEQIQHIDVYGMNWKGGLEHVDFKYPDVVSTCCKKCSIHPTPTLMYGDKGWHFTEGSRNLVVTASASGVGLAVGGAIAFVALTHHAHKTVKRHLKKRAEGKKKEADIKAAAIAEQMLKAPERRPLLALAPVVENRAE